MSASTHKTRNPNGIGYDQLSMLPFDVFTPIIQENEALSQAYLPLPVSCKIYGMSYMFAGPANALNGCCLINVVVAAPGAPWVNDPYETAAIYAQGMYRITGTPATGQNNNYTINGHTVACPQTTGSSLLVQSQADCAVLNAASAAGTFGAGLGYLFLPNTSTVGYIAQIANGPGPSYTVTTTASSSGGDALISSQASLSTGTFASGLITGTPDQFWLTGVHNFAPVHAAVFPADIPITTPVNTPAFAGVPPPLCDVVYQQGTLLSLRTPSPLNLLPSAYVANNYLKVIMLIKPHDVAETRPVNYPFDPTKDIK